MILSCQPDRNNYHMFKSIGTVIVLYAVTQMFSSAVTSLEEALVDTFTFVSTVAEVSTTILETEVYP